MKYLDSEPFSVPVGGKVSQEEWDRIFPPEKSNSNELETNRRVRGKSLQREG